MFIIDHHRFAYLFYDVNAFADTCLFQFGIKCHGCRPKIYLIVGIVRKINSEGFGFFQNLGNIVFVRLIFDFDNPYGLSVD